MVATNPFVGQLRVMNGELRNAQGVVVRSGNLTGNEVVIETSELVSGLYLLRLIDETGATKVVTLVKE